jgi:hypothetical protein
VSDHPPLAVRLGTIVLPALEPRQAEIIIDLIGQLQAVLWDAYGEAILALAPDEDQSVAVSVPPPPPDDGDPIF